MVVIDSRNKHLSSCGYGLYKPSIAGLYDNYPACFCLGDGLFAIIKPVKRGNISPLPARTVSTILFLFVCFFSETAAPSGVYAALCVVLQGGVIKGPVLAGLYAAAVML